MRAVVRVFGQIDRRADLHCLQVDVARDAHIGLALGDLVRFKCLGVSEEAAMSHFVDDEVSMSILNDRARFFYER